MMKIDLVYCFHSYFSVDAFMEQSLISINIKFSWKLKNNMIH